MLRNLGPLLWRQSRELVVSNYSAHIVYELNTNYGLVHCIQDKTTKTITVLSQEELNLPMKQTNSSISSLSSISTLS